MNVVPPLVPPAGQLTTEEARRYSRHVVLADVGMLGQRRLKAAKVVVVGAGGLGSPVLMYLAAAGVGTLGIVDFDVVDESNLQRQVIHGQSSVGISKVNSARDRLREVNPLVSVVGHEERLDSGNARRILAGYDLVVDGSDNFATRYLVNDACVLLAKPCVWGSVNGFDGQVSVFWAEHGPCYRCLHPAPPPAGKVPTCAEGGVLGALCAAIGSIQATEAVKIITGIGHPLIGRLLLHDALAMTFHTVPIARDPQCPGCGVDPSVTDLEDSASACCPPSAAATPPAAALAISAAELATMLAEREAGRGEFVLIDVRDPAEHAAQAIPGSVLIPGDQFLSGEALSGLPRDRTIVLHCYSGARSPAVLALLHSAGFSKARHLEGGILAWAQHHPRGTDGPPTS